MQHPTAIRLAAYADGELKGSEVQELERHLHRCPQCQAELAELRALSARLQSFALPEGLGQDLWEQVERRLPERRAVMERAPNGLLRWLPPIGLIASNAVLQAVMIVALGLWALSSLGLFDWQTLTRTWLPAGVQLPSLPPEEAISYLLSWLVGAPLGPGFNYLVQMWGVDIFDLFSWLIPSALALLAFTALALLYLSWLLAYWKLETRNWKLVSRLSAD